jgi:hypothetical protein
MRNQTMKVFGVAAAMLALAGSAQAQGKGHGKHHEKDRREVVRTANGDVVILPGTRQRVPPGLAKKPGHMPPGQYKKMYSPSQGANVLRDIFRQRGYTVTRLVTSGPSRYVYYRGNDGRIQRAIVSPGTSRLSFNNVPAQILQEVLSRLY